MSSEQSVRRFAIWLSSANVVAAEIASTLGYGTAVLDIEHGTFDLATLDRYIPFLKALGLEVIAKVLEPHRGPIQQALDFGADAVAIPHVLGAQHAGEVTAFAKFPPVGDRSYAGGRTTAYGGYDQEWVMLQDRTTSCYPMVEDATALEDIEDILALPSVDGIFVGPSDLSLRRDRGAYRRTPGDFADLELITQAAAEAGKPWIMPAWSPEEKIFAVERGAHRIIVTMEHSALSSGLASAMREMLQVVG